MLKKQALAKRKRSRKKKLCPLAGSAHPKSGKLPVETQEYRRLRSGSAGRILRRRFTVQCPRITAVSQPALAEQSLS